MKIHEIITETREENFKRWFGNSKVVDGAGRPLVVYRGASSDEGAEFTNNKDYIYTTVNSEYARNFAAGRDGANTSPLYLSLQNPIDLTQFGEKKISVEQFGKVMAKYGVDYKVDDLIAKMKWPVWQFFKRGSLKSSLEAAGYDGVIWNEKRTPDYRGGSKSGRAYIAFNPNQIKSATGNNGEFNPNNPDITKE
jgi:hypothetical protein